jgi:hypothetical protein
MPERPRPAELEQIVDRIVDLSKYAWMFRYPGAPVAG